MDHACPGATSRCPQTAKSGCTKAHPYSGLGRLRTVAGSTMSNEQQFNQSRSPGFRKRTDRDLIEVVKRLEDPSISALDILYTARAFVRNIVGELVGWFPEGDRQRFRWERCCGDFVDLVEEIYGKYQGKTEVIPVLRHAFHVFETTEGQMYKLIYSLDDKDKQASWREDMAVLFRLLSYAIVALWRPDRKPSAHPPQEGER